MTISLAEKEAIIIMDLVGRLIAKLELCGAPTLDKVEKELRLLRSHSKESNTVEFIDDISEFVESQDA